MARSFGADVMSRIRGFLPVSLLALAIGAERAPAAPEERVTIVVSGLHTLNPHAAVTAAEERAVTAVFEGLTVLDATKPEGFVPGVAAKWETSPDGLTWTFHLRPEAKWSDGKPVTAQDFVDSWARLIGIDGKGGSPNAHLLEFVKGGKSLYRDQRLSDKLYALALALRDLINANSGAQGGGISEDDARVFVDDSGFRTATAHMSDPAVIPLRNLGGPLAIARAKLAQKALEAEAKRLKDSFEAACAGVCKDQGWFAKDERTLVIQIAAPIPHLPRVLAHPALVALSKKTLSARQKPFDGYQLPANGPYVSKGPAPDGNHVRKLVLEKNEAYWNAAAVPTKRIDCWIDIDDAIDRWKNGETHWLAHNFGSLGVPGRASLDIPALERIKKEYAADYYETSTGTVYVLRFRCDRKPLDDVKVRRAVAGAIDRVAMVANVKGPKFVPITRLVPSTVKGASPAPPAPAWAKAIPPNEPPTARTARYAETKALLGNTKFPHDAIRILYLTDEALDPAMTALEKTLKEAISIEPERWVLDRSGDYRAEIDKALHHAMLAPVRPDSDDPLAYLERYATGHPQDDVAWRNKAYDALIEGAWDPAAFAKAPPEAAMKAVGDPAPIQAALLKAKGGDAASLATLRTAILQAAERMLLDEAVVVPLWLAPEAGLLRPGVKGIEVRKPTTVVDYHPLHVISHEAAK
jgi:ABC-type oligopeptide transport system substrate-binding subunit